MPRPPRWTDEELLLALELLDRREWRSGNAQTPDFLSLSSLLRAANFPGVSDLDPGFRSVGSVSMKMGNLIGAHPGIDGGMRTSRREIDFVAEFLQNRERMIADAVALRAKLVGAVDSTDADRWDEEETAVAIEGGAQWVLALRRERSQPLRSAKLRQVEAAHGRIACEVCGFDFARVYGSLGAGYIEVHHRTPLHVSGETFSDLNDLALLCSNCHRMVHRRGWLPIHELAQLVASVRSLG